LRGDETHPQRQEFGIGGVWRPAGERDLVAARAPLDVVPKVIHLHVVLRECGIVLLDQDFAQIERLPAHLDARRGSKRADAHDRQIGVDAAVEEIELEMARHGSLSRPLVPAKAGTQPSDLDSRFRRNERSLSCAADSVSLKLTG
jgi:hypothetical protein